MVRALLFEPERYHGNVDSQSPSGPATGISIRGSFKNVTHFLAFKLQTLLTSTSITHRRFSVILHRVHSLITLSHSYCNGLTVEIKIKIIMVYDNK